MSTLDPSQNLTLSVEKESKKEDIDAVCQGLREFNLQHVPDDNHQPLAILLRDPQGKILGGLLGETYWGWLYISIFWLDTSIRGQGKGRMLLRAAEQEAIQRGCHSAHLDTMNFQAQPFYEKEGYQVFGVLDDLPKGNQRIFMYKKLLPPGI
jgi:GNAT superfamily N-acetyltransferase